jgi:hypothetical protein
MTIESIQIIESLRFGLKSFNEMDSFNEQSAIYAIAFNGNAFPVHFGIDKINKGDIIYIGKTESGLKKRIVKTHFKDGKTGSSTLRRSLGAILIDNLSLEAISRSSAEAKFRDYKFINKSEKILTEWMINNLSVSFIPYNRGKRLLRKMESEIIYLLSPILNISRNSNNSNRLILKELREKCRQIARIQQHDIKLL